jgi:phosphopantetheinyl transferase (holo-ACP synthase)
VSIGNDIVDLSRRGARDKAKDERFVRRVCTDSEAAWIQSDRDPDRTLWMIWTAKEAAFKISSRQNGRAVFAHRFYEALSLPEAKLDTGAASAVRLRGTVRVHQEGNGVASTFSVEWELTPRFVHCLALVRSDQIGSVRAVVGEVDDAATAHPPVSWSRRELRSAVSAESRKARILAKQLAHEAGLGPVEIVRSPGTPRLGPPLLYAAGEAAPIEGWHLSLSHDGAFAAAALSRFP